MLQIEELHEAEMLQRLRLVLEERVVKLDVLSGPVCGKLLDPEHRVTVLVLLYPFVVPAEQLNDRFEEVATDCFNSVRGIGVPG